MGPTLAEAIIVVALAAFAELVRRYRGPVFRLAVSILGQEFAPEAEDVAQDVMLRVHHLESIVAAVVISASVATAASAYGRRLLADH